MVREWPRSTAPTLCPEPISKHLTRDKARNGLSVKPQVVVVLRDGDMGEEPRSSAAAGNRMIGRRCCHESYSFRITF